MRMMAARSENSALPANKSGMRPTVEVCSDHTRTLTMACRIAFLREQMPNTRSLWAKPNRSADRLIVP